ncbi:MAG: alpha/beta hydrolase [Candidatus Hydrogenedentes bacterium]|nr:alpha/beta hydrolase [Candidatus Hydrogenedentota bacterium]
MEKYMFKEKYTLSFRAKPTGGGALNGSLQFGNIDALKRASSITFVTHGYNVTEKDGKYRLSNFVRMLGDTGQDAIVSVLWPGDNWLGALAYPFKGRMADDTGRRLALYIRDAGLGGASLSFVSHSLGARVVMETIKALPNTYAFNQVCLMAAAVDDDCLTVLKQYQPLMHRIRRVAVLASKWDSVLLAAYPLGDLTHFFQDFGNKPGLALGLHGPRPKVIDRVHYVQIDNVEPDARAGHGHYLPTPESKPFVQKKREAAARFAQEVIKNEPSPVYKIK